MKGIKNELNRVKMVLENDRLGISEVAKGLLVSELSKLFSNYFTLKNTPQIKIESCDKGFFIVVSVEGDCFKTFKTIA